MRAQTRLPLVRTAAFLFLLAGAAGPRLASADAWVPLGPDGGAVTAVAVHPGDANIVYVGTDGGGVFKTVDGGLHWSAANRGLGSVFLRSLVIDPSAPDTLYAGTAGTPFSLGNGVFKSMDGGKTWFERSEGLPIGPRFCLCDRLPVDFIVLDPHKPRTLYAVQENGISKTIHGGFRWFLLADPGKKVTAAAVDPFTGDLYTGSSQGVVRYGGRQDRPVVLRNGLGGTEVRALAFHPRLQSVLYAGTDAGVFKSTDAGATWKSANVGLTDPRVLSLAIDPLFPATVYAGTEGGLFKSTGGGRRWVRFGAGIPAARVGVLTISPSAPDILYGGTGRLGPGPTSLIPGPESGPGVFRSADGGATWEVRSRGIFAAEVTSLAASRTPPRVLYAGTDGQGVFKSFDGGTVWLPASGGLSDLGVRALAVVPTSPSVVYAGTRTGVFKTLDGGASWTLQVNAAGTGDGVRALAVDPLGLPIVYAAALDRVYRSTDGGDTWEQVLEAPFQVLALAVAPSNPSTLYAGGASNDVLLQQHVWKSFDGGDTWAAPGNVYSHVSALAVDPRNANVVYAGTYNGLNWSLDGGAIWGGRGLPAMAAVAIDGVNPDLIYAGTLWSGVFAGTVPDESDESDEIWKLPAPGLQNPLVLALAADPLAPCTLYAGLRGGSVYRLERTGCGAP